MAVGIILGVALVVVGLVLLCHLSYTNLGEKPESDVEDPTLGSVRPKHNDCFLPCCFFQVAQVKNHETWVLVCLLGGATVLVLSMA
jgi:hypothetical protein